MVATAKPTITLREFDSADWPIIWKWIEGYYWSVADDYAPTTMHAFVESQRRRGSKNLAFYRGNELVGLIMFVALNPYLCECHIYFKRSFWGRENTIPALRLAHEWIHRETNFQKCSMPIFANNRHVVRVLREFGAEQEAHLRAHTTQRGKPIDVLMFALFREE